MKGALKLGQSARKCRYVTVSSPSSVLIAIDSTAANSQVEMHYNNGRFGVAANTSKPHAAGFKTSISYSDGRGTAIAPRTGRQVTVTGSTVISGANFGLTNEMVMTPK